MRIISIVNIGLQTKKEVGGCSKIKSYSYRGSKVKNRIRNGNILWKDDRKSKFHKMVMVSNFLRSWPSSQKKHLISHIISEVPALNQT